MELKAKQDYLFTEILQANYDPEVFQEYMQRQRGVDLDAYSLQELIQVVQQFKGINKDQKQPEKILQQPSTKSESPPLNAGDFKQESMQKDSMIENEVKKSDSFNTSTKVFHQFIKKQQLPQLYRRVHQQRENVRVKIRSYSKETDQSLFGGTYIAYLLQTGTWDVRRRFKDFEWLHSRLSLVYPGLPIPPIPRKTALRSFEDRHLEERMVFFELFVNRLLQIPELCSDPVLEDFLSVAGQQEWATCRQRFEIRLNNQGNKVISLKGDGIINTSQFAIEPKQTQSLARSLELTRTINTLLSSFQKALRIATERAFELAATLGEAFRELQKEGTRGSQVVELMGQFVSELGYRLDSECFFVKGNLEDYWAYEEKYQQNLLAAIAKNSKDNLELLAKAKSLNQHQPELEDAPKSRSLAEYLAAKEQYRIRLSFTLDEMRRHKDEDLKVVGKDWASALGQYIGGIKDLMLSGADQLTKALCVSQGKQLRQVEYLASRQRHKESVLQPKESDH